MALDHQPSGCAAPRSGDALDGLEFWYQPKIDLKRKCLAGAEALAPESLSSGLDEASLVRFAEHALLAVMRDWSRFAAAGFSLKLAVALPAGTLWQTPIAAIVGANRPRSESWPGLIVQASEDQLSRDIALARDVAAELKACGVAIAIDVFGTGYSSFSGLRELPFAELKLDHSYVTDCATDAHNAAICQTAIDLAHRFGGAAAAQGVVAVSDLQALAVMGCDLAQGRLLAPPMPKEQFLNLLQQRRTPPQQEAAPTGQVA